MFIDRLNQERHKLSSLGSLLLVFVVVNLAQTLKTPAENLAQEAMELTTTLIEPLLKPPPQLTPPPVRQPEVKPKVITSTVSPAEPMKEVSTPEPNRASTPIAQPVTQPMAPAPVQSVEAPKMQPPAAVAVSLENNYIASVRATLNANKRYPTGREASLQRPSGKVKVWFVLLRNGSLQEAGIDESSNSIILDNAALSTVRRTAYAPWPESTWPNLAQHKFTVTLEFVPLN